MVIMALDHTRDYFGDAAASPTNLASASAALFATRWITNICAPVFFLLAGTGAYLALRRRSRPTLSRYLVTRGLWLIVLEFTVMRFILQFNVDYHLTILTVLWALGWSMIVLGALVHLPVSVVAAFGVVLIAGHNVLDGIDLARFGAFAPLAVALHGPGMLYNGARVVIFAAYPLIPWIGVTAVGFALGQVYDWSAERRQRTLWRLGVALTVAFVALRAVNVYGDPVRWSVQHSGTFTVLSFLNTTKYPPSLLFLLMTLGPALLMLAAFDATTPRVLRPALVVGRVPMFYYLLHFLVIHLLAMAAALVRYGDASGMTQSPTFDWYPITQPPGWPASLPVVYLVCATVVLLVYPACRWYAALRARRTDWWLGYL